MTNKPTVTLPNAKIVRTVRKWEIGTFDDGHRWYASDGWFCDYPVLSGNAVYYDRPERIPEYAKRAIEKALRAPR